MYLGDRSKDYDTEFIKDVSTQDTVKVEKIKNQNKKKWVIHSKFQ